MFLVPLVAGFCVSRLIAEPIFHVVQQQSPSAFSPSETQKVGLCPWMLTGMYFLTAVGFGAGRVAMHDNMRANLSLAMNL